MTEASIFLQRAARLTAPWALLALPLAFSSCSSTNIKGVPSRLPEIALSGSTATPLHHMASYEYPFDSNGNYVSDWAAEGERRAGRSRSATNDDETKWSGSHGGRAASPASSKKSTAGKSQSKSKSKSGGGSKYVVKKGDTVERIARRYGISVSRLKAANGLKSDLIRDGRTLTIPK